MKKKLIRIKNLRKEFRTKKETTVALKNISLDIYEGEILGLLGVNGAGKTTLSSILATLHPPTSGDLFFEDKSIYNSKSDLIRNINLYREQIGFCPQKPNVIEELTVRQNLVFSGRYFSMPEKEIKKRLKELVKKYELSKYLDKKPEILSGGYKQRLMIARALMHAPKIIILDEPTVGLDPHIRKYLWNNIKDLKDIGVTVILTTHYLEEAELLSDRICILHKGSIKLLDTPENIKLSYQKKRLVDVFIQLMEEESVL